MDTNVIDKYIYNKCLILNFVNSKISLTIFIFSMKLFIVTQKQGQTKHLYKLFFIDFMCRVIQWTRHLYISVNEIIERKLSRILSFTILSMAHVEPLTQEITVLILEIFYVKYVCNVKLSFLVFIVVRIFANNLI